MPVNKAKYPVDWKVIALGTKSTAGWNCLLGRNMVIIS